MSITRINEFKAKAERIDELRELLTLAAAAIAALDGNMSCRLLQSHDDPTRFVVVEQWRSIEAHQASVKNIPPEMFASAMALLDGMPRGEYFEESEKLHTEEQ
jgi:quinol monooxygenase YgiN